MNALANMAWNETMPPPMIEERTLLDFDIVQDFIYQKNGIKKPLESVRGSLVRRLLEYSPTRTDHNGLNENLLFLSAVSDECFFLRSFTRRTASFGRTKIQMSFVFQNLFFSQRHKYNQRRV